MSAVSASVCVPRRLSRCRYGLPRCRAALTGADTADEGNGTGVCGVPCAQEEPEGIFHFFYL